MYFCTLFDSYYMNRGVAMHESLLRTCPEAKLFIFAFDDLSEKILTELDLKNVTVVSRRDFENEKLLSVKADRSAGEYCWTCTPFVIEYCLDKYKLPECTYIDADLFFFENPGVLVDEMGADDVLITDHRYTRKYDDSATSGIYCVQFITFRNNARARTVLNWWRDRCFEWCYARFEDGKFGDQKYLDHWPSQFEGVHVLQHEGGGVAPWNIQQYDTKEEQGKFIVQNNGSGAKIPLVFYHFHAVKFFKDGLVDYGAYQLPESSLKLYTTYLSAIRKANELLSSHGFAPVIQQYKSKKFVPAFFHKFVRYILGVYDTGYLTRS